MPITTCTKDGKPGYKYGPEGTCYPYTPGNEDSRRRALTRANQQRKAIEQSRHEDK